MPSMASGSNPEPPSHHSNSNHEDCPDQLKNSEEASRQLSFAILHPLELENLGSAISYLKFSLTKIFVKEGRLNASSYPPPFLLFSALLN